MTSCKCNNGRRKESHALRKELHAVVLLIALLNDVHAVVLLFGASYFQAAVGWAAFTHKP